MTSRKSAVLATDTHQKRLDMLPDSFVFQRIEDIQDALGTVDTLQQTMETLLLLERDDVNKPALIEWLNEGIALDDRRWEIRAALRTLARVLQPRTYLEIGTRRGWSLAQVACESPYSRIWSMDMWVEDYAGVANPGPDFVMQELQLVAPNYCGKITFLNGNSHDVLPVFLDGAPDPDGRDEDLDLVRAHESRPTKFDLITVDGDHTAVGAWWDLCDIMPHVALGGAVVFDDLVEWSDEVTGGAAETRFAGRHAVPEDLSHSLLDVWNHLKRHHQNFVYLENLGAAPPIGIAIRTS